jgi:microcystin degradation protein MlrC
MRIALACVMQESNSFAPGLTEFEDFLIEPGESLRAVYGGTNTEMAGFLEELDRLRDEPVPLVSVYALSGGPVSKRAFGRISELLQSQLNRSELDGLLIALHGAWVSEDGCSADAELAGMIRETVGREKPVVATLDFHANLQLSLLNELDAVVGYRTYPHIDMAETGRKAARIIHDLVTAGTRTCTYWLPIPLLAPPQSAVTDRSPIRETIRALDGSLSSRGILSSSFFCVQPWLDIQGVSSGIAVVARPLDETIPVQMRKIAQELWERRNEFVVDWVGPQELTARIRKEVRRPVIVSEAFDSPTGGAPGDNPGLLSTLTPSRNELSACIFVVDPESASLARRIGVGGLFHGELCAKQDEGIVVHLSDGEFVHRGPAFTGRKGAMGPTAILEAGRMKIVVASRPVMTIDPELYRSQKIEPQEQDAVAVKSPSLFRPGYAPITGCIVDLDMPGVCRGNLKEVPFLKIERPLYPLDDIEWDASKQAVLLSHRKASG